MTLHEFIKHRAWGRYLEIGVNEGNSLLAAVSNKLVTFAVGIDTWTGGYGGENRGSPDHVLQKFNSDAPILLITGDSKEIVPRLAGKFDTILVDGDHSPQGALADLENCLQLLNPKTGSLLLDDIDHPAHPYLRGLAEEFAKKHNLFIQFHDAHFGVAELHVKYPPK